MTILRAERFLSSEEHKTGLSRQSKIGWEEAYMFAEAYADYRAHASPAVAGRTQGDERAKFDMWYKANYPKISGTSSWVERAWATWQAALRESAREAPSKDIFWPPANATEEHLYEIRNGKVKEYVMEHVQALQSETLEALRNMTEIAQGLLRGECYDRAGPKFLAHFHNAQRILGRSASPEAPTAPKEK